MLSYVKNLLPSPVVLLYGLIVPTIISLYVFVDRSLINTVNSSEVNYFSFADSWLGTIIIDQSWQIWLARALDFVLWGVIGGLILLMFWVISSSRIAIHNHKVQEKFVNFNIPKGTWHSHFAVIALVKALILFLIIYCLGILVFSALPPVIDSASTLSNGIDLSSGLSLGLSIGFMILMQYLVVFAIKLFRSIEVDN